MQVQGWLGPSKHLLYIFVFEVVMDTIVLFGNQVIGSSFLNTEF